MRQIDGKCGVSILRVANGGNRTRKLALRLLAILVVCSVATIAGCSSSSEKATSAEAGVSSEAESVETASQLEPADLAGWWVVDRVKGESGSKLLQEGVLMTFKFDEKGNFKIVIYLADEVVKRSGTYRIEDGKLFLSIPATLEQDVNYRSYNFSLSGEAFEDAEVTVDGDRFTTTALSKDGSETGARKVSEEQYKNYVEQVKALAPKKIKVGKTYDTGTATFTVDSFSYVDAVYPSDTSSYYTYMKEEDGKSYLLAEVTFTNNGTEFTNPGQCTKATFNVGENKYEGEVAVDQGSHFGKYYSVDAKDAAQLHIYCSVPDAARDSGEAKLTWSFPSAEWGMKTYYQASSPHDDYVLTL